MAVDIEVVDANKPSSRILNRAAHIIAKGKVIVCPTDTGYALAANALDAKAVLKVFSLKGRAYSNPIHIAVSSMEAAEKYALLNKTAEHLAHSFLPGALTLVLPKKEIIPSLLVAGLETIGIRIPDNRVILDLAAMTNLPITATSANLSGQSSPLTAEEVDSQLGGKIKYIINGGKCPGGKESTLVDVTGEAVVLLREGAISREELEQVCGNVLYKEGE